MVFALLGGLAVAPLGAQQPRPSDARPSDQAASTERANDAFLQVADYLDLERVGSPELSPDGTQIIYTRSHVNKLEDSWDSELWIMNVDGSRKRFLGKGSEPTWSSDGTRIAYLAEGEPDGAQIFVRWMDAEGATSQVTRVTESPSSIEWSPDGESIAFVMLVPEEESWSIDTPSAPEGANWTKAPRMVTKTHYRQDRRGFMEEGFTHLFVVPAEGGTPRQLTSGDWNVGARFSGLGFGAGIDWTADGREIVFDGLLDESPELDGYAQTYIYAVDVASGDVRQVVTEKGNWTGPVVAPDGERVAFTGYPFVAPSLGGAVWLAPGLRLRASVGRALRAPTWTDRYYSDPANIGNPSLEPERAWEGEIGVDLEAGSARASLSSFVRSARSLIDWARPLGGDPSAPWQTMNVESATFRGLEVALTGVDFIDARWTARASVIAVDAEAAASYESKYALRPLTRQASVEVDRTIVAGIDVFLGAAYARRADEDGRVQFDARFSRRFGDLRISADVVNATATEYLDISRMPAAGRAIHIGLGWRRVR